MTTQEKFTKMLTDRGMFDSQAGSVMEMFKTEVAEIAAGYKMTWDRPASEYPDPLYAAMKPTLFKCAIEWIDKNLPMAWFRDMFL